MEKNPPRWRKIHTSVAAIHNKIAAMLNAYHES
jgi:hypothetical protein